MGSSAGASARTLCGAMSPEASVLLSSCSLDSEVTRNHDESCKTLSLGEERRGGERRLKDKGGEVRTRRRSGGKRLRVRLRVERGKKGKKD